MVLSLLRRSYEAMALFALLNLLGLAALGAFLVASGAVTGEKTRMMLSVMRGEKLVASAKTDQPPPGDSTSEAEQDSGQKEKDAFAGSQRDLEITRREAERIKAELDQRLALNNSILLRIATQRAEFQEERGAAQKETNAREKKQQDEGFRKQIALLESVSPKIAVEHLLALSDPDEAARILLEMETRKAKKIIESAKRGEALEKMKVILQRVRDASPEGSTELASGP